MSSCSTGQSLRNRRRGNERESDLVTCSRALCARAFRRAHLLLRFGYMSSFQYRGRLAPSPTGYLHLGHARTFWTAQQRAIAAHGVLVLRSDDIDAVRAKMAFAEAMLEDLCWLGLRWQEGPDCGGPLGPYEQSKR